jgi:hypothetical protein
MNSVMKAAKRLGEEVKQGAVISGMEVQPWNLKK